jgi:hypothetical protein
MIERLSGTRAHAASSSIVVMLNWTEELKHRVPAK